MTSPEEPAPQPTFGDRVRIRSSPETEALGVAGRVGPVFGESVPSASGVPVIGDPTFDFALAVYFEDRSESLWFSPDLVEFISHDPGTVITLQGVPKRWVRQIDGSWAEESTGPAHTHQTETPLTRFLGWLEDNFLPRFR